ncbi:conserved hypothetical protein [Leptospira interrogans serovar Manilae]|uniref:Phospholipase n=1 Tax=Leptospira interrogans serovar Manilae TaxID=214675 RepID=A0AAQ1NWI7_LEPIR|nr:hypothetical protein [Leptospira interrogans]AKP24896.1 hypothetical protein LIMLP_02325 [Leptospira interrogans serovar Manilae]AKP28679.1 hypothetical protein LIMHP_02315 [Leptospira interrogans serovar Manilae]EYU64123.1 hypothetical protein CI00_09810 [Leptospira interrogans serovar Manilae]SOR60871.1 conserved hypothetical protein [Leptospira interrogans serovar Manilae]
MIKNQKIVMKQKTFVVFLLLFILPTALFPWGTHYLIMDQILEHPSMKFISGEVESESLDSFVKKEKNSLKVLFDEFAVWEESRGSKRFKKIEFHPETASVIEFLKAARLNPATRFLEVERILTGSKPMIGNVPVSSITPYLLDHSELPARFQSTLGKKVKLRNILYTFIDEPDWGMDHDLWSLQEYGYGKQPYGKAEGEGSKAPFHMQFQNENWILSLFVPEVVKGGMILDRIELFSRLSKLAGKTGHNYWQYRFATWACHYIQDIGQPYHSKAVPDADFSYYARYIFSSKETKKDMKAKATQLVTNRHFLYEDFISYNLIDFYKNSTTRTLTEFLVQNSKDFPSFSSNEDLMKFVGKEASVHAFQINQSIIDTFGEKYTMKPEYDLEKELGTKMKEIIPTLNSEKRNLLLKEAGRDFSLTGFATREMLHLILQDSNHKN